MGSRVRSVMGGLGKWMDQLDRWLDPPLAADLDDIRISVRSSEGDLPDELRDRLDRGACPSRVQPDRNEFSYHEGRWTTRWSRHFDVPVVGDELRSLRARIPVAPLPLTIDDEFGLQSVAVEVRVSQQQDVSERFTFALPA